MTNFRLYDSRKGTLCGIFTGFQFQQIIYQEHSPVLSHR